MNLRQSITRKITYSIVTVTHNDGHKIYMVYGETTPAKEMKKLLKEYQYNDIPTITVVTKTEKRAISLETFINNSNIINNESEEI